MFLENWYELFVNTNILFGPGDFQTWIRSTFFVDMRCSLVFDGNA